VERVNTGIKGLDDMVAEGFWRGSTTLIAGPSGSGKTIMALHFIRQGALQDEPVAVFGISGESDADGTNYAQPGLGYRSPDQFRASSN
jgi:circadian clock protein KaiC